MAAKVISDINEKVLLCSVCHGRFQTPKTLICQHSFCLSCIEGWVKTNGGVLSCPMCRKNCVIPDKGITELPSSYFINQLLEYTTDEEECKLKVNSCTMCKKTSTAHCMECTASLCEQCAGNHCNLLLCRDHTVMPLDVYQSMDAKDRAAAKPVMCPKHTDVAVEFYCVGCASPVCLKCSVVTHKGHDLQELETAFENFIEDAKTILGQCKYKEEEMEEGLVQHRRDTEAQKQSATTCKQEVERHAEKLHNLVEDAKKKLLEDLNKRSKFALQNSEDAKRDKEEKKVQLQNLTMFIESLMKAPQPTTALFDANETLNKARLIIGRRVAVAPGKSQLLSLGSIRPTKRSADDSNSTKPFYFKEDQNLTSLLSKSIGEIKCQQPKDACASTSKKARIVCCSSTSLLFSNIE
ncbi:E3 ubiquitin-protein ligase TRIM33-like [Anneissia japonica]|uniref:E3 ubiquitin-protein ligase TRIM33-like n=1 Tax=Anneissia japonica TaxID=1529436 RepID=UPI0014259DA3|nr:E3 ubiquitin-protein ligase TRIM33-like [Anneissia japonica]